MTTYRVVLHGFKHGDPVTPWVLGEKTFQTLSAASKFAQQCLDADGFLFGKITRAVIWTLVEGVPQAETELRRKFGTVLGGKAPGTNVVFADIRKVAESDPFAPDIA